MPRFELSNQVGSNGSYCCPLPLPPPNGQGKALSRKREKLAARKGFLKVRKRENSAPRIPQGAQLPKGFFPNFPISKEVLTYKNPVQISSPVVTKNINGFL